MSTDLNSKTLFATDSGPTSKNADIDTDGSERNIAKNKIMKLLGNILDKEPSRSELTKPFIPNFNIYQIFFININPGMEFLNEKVVKEYNIDHCNSMYFKSFSKKYTNIKSNLNNSETALYNKIFNTTDSFTAEEEENIVMLFKKILKLYKEYFLKINSSFEKWQDKVEFTDQNYLKSHSNVFLNVPYNYHLIMSRIDWIELAKAEYHTARVEFEKCVETDRNGYYDCYKESAHLMSILLGYTNYFDVQYSGTEEEQCLQYYLETNYQINANTKRSRMLLYIKMFYGIVKPDRLFCQGNDFCEGNIKKDHYLYKIYEPNKPINKIIDEYDEMLKTYVDLIQNSIKNNSQTFDPKEDIFNVESYFVIMYNDTPMAKFTKYKNHYMKCLGLMESNMVTAECEPYIYFSCNKISPLMEFEKKTIKKYYELYNNRIEVNKIQLKEEDRFKESPHLSYTDNKVVTLPLPSPSADSMKMNTNTEKNLRIRFKDSARIRTTVSSRKSKTSENFNNILNRDMHINRNNNHVDYKQLIESHENSINQKHYSVYWYLNVAAKARDFMVGEDNYSWLVNSYTISVFLMDVVKIVRNLYYCLLYYWQIVSNQEVQFDMEIVFYKTLTLVAFFKLMENYYINDLVWVYHSYYKYQDYNDNIFHIDSVKKMCKKYNTFEDNMLPVESGTFDFVLSKRTNLLNGVPLYYYLFRDPKVDVPLSDINMIYAPSESSFRNTTNQFNHYILSREWRQVFTTLYFYLYIVKSAFNYLSLTNYAIINIMLIPEEFEEILDQNQAVKFMLEEYSELSQNILPNELRNSVMKAYSNYAGQESELSSYLDFYRYASTLTSLVMMLIVGDKYYIDKYIAFNVGFYLVLARVDYINLQKLFLSYFDIRSLNDRIHEIGENTYIERIVPVFLKHMFGGGIKATFDIKKLHKIEEKVEQQSDTVDKVDSSLRFSQVDIIDNELKLDTLEDYADKLDVIRAKLESEEDP